jgi:hypothetical protein
MSARLPTVGGDDGNWGTVLNDFLLQEHNADGSQKDIAQSKITNLTTDLAAKVELGTLGYELPSAYRAKLAPDATTSANSNTVTSGQHAFTNWQVGWKINLYAAGYVGPKQILGAVITAVANNGSSITLDRNTINAVSGVYCWGGPSATSAIQAVYTAAAATGKFGAVYGNGAYMVDTSVNLKFGVATVGGGASAPSGGPNLTFMGWCGGVTIITDAAISSGSKILMSTQLSSVALGQYIQVNGAGPSGRPLVSFVTALGSGTATLYRAASTTVSSSIAVVCPATLTGVLAWPYVGGSELAQAPIAHTVRVQDAPGVGVWLPGGIGESTRIEVFCAYNAADGININGPSFPASTPTTLTYGSSAPFMPGRMFAYVNGGYGFSFAKLNQSMNTIEFLSGDNNGMGFCLFDQADNTSVITVLGWKAERGPLAVSGTGGLAPIGHDDVFICDSLSNAIVNLTNGGKVYCTVASSGAIVRQTDTHIFGTGTVNYLFGQQGAVSYNYQYSDDVTATTLPSSTMNQLGTAASAGLTPVTVSANATLKVGQIAQTNTQGGQVILTTPASASAGSIIGFLRTLGSSSIILSPQAGQTLLGSTSIITVNAAVSYSQGVLLQYDGVSNWNALSAWGTDLFHNTYFAQSPVLSSGLYIGTGNSITTNTTLTGTSAKQISAAGGSLTITLNLTNASLGPFAIIKRTDSSNNTVTLSPSSGQTIEGAAGYLLAPGEGLIITLIGTDYKIYARFHNQININTLPIAGSQWRGHTVVLQGNGTTTADIAYICLMSSTGTYNWKQITTG